MQRLAFAEKLDYTVEWEPAADEALANPVRSGRKQP
jgi:hypothetical protein